MENQQKTNFLIVVFVLVMHVLLFWAVFKGQQVKSDQNITLDFVNLGVSEDSAGSNNVSDEPKASPSPPPKSIPQVKPVTHERARIKPAVATKTDSNFKVQQEEKAPKDRPVITEEKRVPPADSKPNTSTISDKNNLKESNQNDGKSGDSGKKNNGNQNSGEIKVPREYLGSYLPGLKPVYPVESEEAGEQGVVVVSVSVDANGKAVDVRVVKSSGSSRLDRSARQAVQRHRFKPATRDGIPIPYKYKFNVNFSIKY